MTRVLLVHAGIIPHYRIPIYGYLSRYLAATGFSLVVVSNGIQPDIPEPIEFRYVQLRLSPLRIARLVRKEQIDVIIDFMALRHWYLFPTYFIVKGLMRRKMIYWGQGRDLLDLTNCIKNLAYTAEQSMCASIILYADHLIKYVPKRFHNKTFIANNTLCFSYARFSSSFSRKTILEKYGIETEKNIICMGRMQERKRIDHLIKAFLRINRPTVGLIFIGPDVDGILEQYNGPGIYKLGPIYGNEKLDLLCAADVACIPGAVGLSIVDAFYCGLPFVTEEGDESAEVFYLKEGINGFTVPRGDISALSNSLLLLLEDDNLRKRFSDKAKEEIRSNGSMEGFCLGFKNALCYATGRE